MTETAEMALLAIAQSHQQIVLDILRHLIGTLNNASSFPGEFSELVQKSAAARTKLEQSRTHQEIADAVHEAAICIKEIETELKPVRDYIVQENKK